MTQGNELRLKMLSWLVIPVVMVLALSGQIIRTVASFDEVVSPSATPSIEDNTVTSLPSIPDFQYQNTGLITLWFDDAWGSQYEIGLPVLDKYNFDAALAVPTRVVGTYNYMNWLQVKRLQHKGWEITAHSRTHNCEMEDAKQAQVDFEVVGSLQDLKTKGIRKDIYVTPCGVENPIIESVVIKNYPMGLRTSNPGLNSLPVSDRFDITVMAIRNTTTVEEVRSWLAQAKVEKKWVILMFHRLDIPVHEFDTNPGTFASIIELVKASGLPVVLPSQVLKIPGTGTISESQSVNQPINEVTPETVLEELSDNHTVGEEEDAADSKQDNEPSTSSSPSVIKSLLPISLP